MGYKEFPILSYKSAVFSQEYQWQEVEFTRAIFAKCRMYRHAPS